MAGVLVVPDGRLLCGVCGRAYHHLAQHVRLAHGFDADEYRAWAGLNRQTRLMSAALRARLRQVTLPLIARLRAEGKLKRWDVDPERWRRAKEAAVAVIREGKRPEGRERQRERFTPERRSQLAARRRELNLRRENVATGAQIAAGLRRALGEGTCDGCGAALQRRGTRHRWCEACAKAAARARGRESKARARLRAAHGEAAAPHRRTPPAPERLGFAACGRCGVVFPRRSNSHRWCDRCAPAVAREQARLSAARKRLRRRLGEAAVPRLKDPLAAASPRMVDCPRCGTAFLAASHRERSCPPCRPERLRELRRAWKARQRAAGDR